MTFNYDPNRDYFNSSTASGAGGIGTVDGSEYRERGRTYQSGFNSVKSVSPEVRQEQVNRDNKKGGYTFACDIWSWGVLVCELIGGFNPFQG